MFISPHNTHYYNYKQVGSDYYYNRSTEEYRWTDPAKDPPVKIRKQYIAPVEEARPPTPPPSPPRPPSPPKPPALGDVGDLRDMDPIQVGTGNGQIVV